MTIREVQTAQQARTFLAVHVELNRHEHGFIRPLDKDVEQVFDPEKNKSFRQGKACRWLLLDENGKAVGRIAAFTNRKYKNKGDQQATGCFGFFDCRNKPEEAALLLHTARIWLEKMGMQAMDGPVNFGERDRFWGLLVDGFEAPPYGMNFNPPYYESLLTSAGFRPFYHQICYRRPVRDALPQRFLDVHKNLKKRASIAPIGYGWATGNAMPAIFARSTTKLGPSTKATKRCRKNRPSRFSRR